MRPFVTSLVLTLAVVAATVLYGDPAHRWRKRVSLVRLPTLPGEILVHPVELDERELKARLAAASGAPELFLGSSRVQPVGSDIATRPPDAVLNLGVSGASAEDYLALWQARKETGRLTTRVTIFVDPWVFNIHREQSRWVTNRALVLRFATESPDVSAILRASLFEGAMKTRADELAELVSWPSFRAAIDSLRLRAPEGVRVEAEDALLPTERATRADGSLIYDARSRDVDSAKAAEAARVFALAKVVYSLKSFELDTNAVQLLVALVRDMKRSGALPILVAPPFHPLAAELMAERAVPARALGIYRVELQRLAASEGVLLVDALDAATAGCTADDFMDGMHPKPTCLRKVVALEQRLLEHDHISN